MRPETSAELTALDTTLTSIEKVMNPADLSDRARELAAKAADPSLWDDHEHAQQVTSELSQVQVKLKRLQSQRSRLTDLPIMY